MTELLKVTLTLKSPAKNLGGDRYETLLKPTDTKPFVIYLPQSITRSAAGIKQTLILTVEEVK
jgi:hypothetical protein